MSCAQEKKHFGRANWIVAAALVVCAGLCAVWLWLRSQQDASPAGLTAVLYHNNQPIACWQLSDAPAAVDLQADYQLPIRLEFDNGQVRFVDVDCPDHICEQTGFISQPGESIVCMPNRAVLTILPAEQADALAISGQ